MTKSVLWVLIACILPYISFGLSVTLEEAETPVESKIILEKAAVAMNCTQLVASAAGFGPDTGDEPGYDTYQNLGAAWVVGAENWQFQFTDPDGNVFLYETGSFFNTINLDAIEGICYGTNYDVQVQAMVGGVWCGWGPTVNIIMEDFPSVAVQDAYCNTVVGLYTIVQCDYIGNCEGYIWRFVTDNGTTEFEYNSGTASLVILDDIPQVRYNKIYQISVKAKVCGVWGDYTEMCIITTGPLPYTQLLPEFCDAEYQAIVQFSWVPGATEYWARIFPVDPDDPNFIPQGPVTMYHINDPSGVVIPLYQLGLEQPNVYAVQVKPYVGEQEGDYGPVCLIYYGVPVQFNGDDEQQFMAGDEKGQMLPTDINVYPNPNAGENLYFTLEEDLGNLSVSIFDQMGSRVQSGSMNTSRGINELQFDRRLNPGIYNVSISDEERLIMRSRFIVH